MTILKADVTAGVHEGTDLINSNQIILASPPLFTLFPGDNSMWQVNGDAWTINEDQASLNNLRANNDFLNAIWGISQTAPNPVTFRVIASGNIPAPASEWSIQLILTDAGGLGGTILGQKDVNFPTGEFTAQQVSVTVTPTAPARYLYAYIFCRYSAGSITVWNAEVFEHNSTTRYYGVWTSKILDVFKETNDPIATTGLILSKHLFYYGDISNVDGDYSVEHSIEMLTKFDYVVMSPPNEITNPRQQYIHQQIIKSKTKVFGYVQAGHLPNDQNPPTVASIEALVQQCAQAGYYGVFYDMFGYDWNISRTFQNQIVDYAHSLGLKVFANAWNPPDALSSNVDSTWNPTGTPPHLGVADWYLLESFYQRSDSRYAGDPEGGFANSFAKYQQAVNLASPLGVSVCGLAYAFSKQSLADTTDLANAWLLAIGFGMAGLAYGSTGENDVIDWYDWPTIPVGTVLIQPYQLINGLCQAKTDAGVIWFQTIDSPVSRAFGTFSTALSTTVVFSAAPIANVSRIDATWQVSGDLINWTDISGSSYFVTNTQNRYFRYRMELRS